MTGLLGILIAIIVVALICYIVMWALDRIPLQEPFRTVIIVLVALVLIIFIIKQFGLLASF